MTGHPQDAKAPNPITAPLDQYLMADRNAEIAMARSAAPEAISRNTDVLVLGTAWLGNRSQRKERLWIAGICQSGGSKKLIEPKRTQIVLGVLCKPFK